MITLTTPIAIQTLLGGASAASYGKMSIVEPMLDPLTQSITAKVQISDTANTTLPVIVGSLVITTEPNSPTSTMLIPALNISSVVPLSAADVTVVQGWIAASQNNLEAGVISIGQVAGVQAPGV